MEVDIIESSTHSGKKFEFCDIEWVFENFYLASCKDNFIFQTPEFTIRGFHTTRWVMILTSDFGEKEDVLKLNLKRSDSDPGPETIWVDWRIEINCPDYEQDSVNKVCCFRKGSVSGEDLGSIASKLVALKSLESDLLILQCKMLLFNEESSKGFQPCSNTGIRSLSKDLLQLFCKGEYRDLILAFKHNSIKVHKIVACSRLKELNFLIEQERRKSSDKESDERDILDLSHLNYDAMVNIMKYAYSGDLKHVLSVPSLFIHDCIQKFDMPEVKSYYVPNKLCFRSSVDKSEINFVWIISENKSLKFKVPMKSPVFIDDSSGTIWQLHLTPSDDGKSDYFDLQVENMVDKEIVAYIECGIVDNSNRYFFVKRWRCPPPTAPKMYDFYQFLSLNVLKSFSEDICPRIVVRIRVLNGSPSTCIEKQNISFVEYTPAEKCYNLLSAQMDSAYNAGFFSDLNLEINKTVYKIHKSIIAARSSKMHELLSQKRMDGVDPFSDYEPNVFRILLRFLYTGVALESDFEGDYIDLYDAAVDFGLTALKEFSLLFL